MLTLLAELKKVAFFKFQTTFELWCGAKLGVLNLAFQLLERKREKNLWNQSKLEIRPPEVNDALKYAHCQFEASFTLLNQQRRLSQFGRRLPAEWLRSLKFKL